MSVFILFSGPNCRARRKELSKHHSDTPSIYGCADDHLMQPDGHQPSQSAPRSTTIPFPSTHIPRTHSELQLRDDTAAAEFRDWCMFHRVVGGIRERQRAQHIQRYEQIRRLSHDPFRAQVAADMDRVCHMKTEKSIENIIRTRGSKFDTEQSALAPDSKGGEPLPAVCDQEQPPPANLYKEYNSDNSSQVIDDEWSLEGYPTESSPSSQLSGFRGDFNIMKGEEASVADRVDTSEEDVFQLDL